MHFLLKFRQTSWIGMFSEVNKEKVGSPQIYMVVEQFGAENISLLSGRLVILSKLSNVSQNVFLSQVVKSNFDAENLNLKERNV